MKQGIEEFVVFSKNNKAVQSELKALQGKSYEEACAGFVKVGAKHGYKMTADEVEALIEEAAAHKALKGGELSDDQLEAVAGGKGGGGGAFGKIMDDVMDQIGSLFGHMLDD
jgi:hypothetical protein